LHERRGAGQEVCCARQSLDEEEGDAEKPSGNLVKGPSGKPTPPGKAGQQPEASLARWRGDPSCEA